RGDDSWDPVWDAATTVDDEGWTAELRIPFSQLRFDPGSDVWGVQFSRRIVDTREHLVFSFTPKRERGGVARYGHLVGIEGVQPGRNVEVLPYAVGRAEYLEAEPDNPFRDGTAYIGGVGVDLKYGLTSNLTLDATINPDFGQVEVDPAVVNLSAFETFFQEKRPFFVEGADIFGGGADLFYSRRIGRRPQGSLPDEAAHADRPESTTILGAAKVTGRTANGWSIGLLEAVTGREEAAYVDTLGVRGRAPVEPLTNHLVGRLRRDLRSGETVLGLKATAANRRLDTDALAGRLRSSAYAGGFDFKHEWANRAWAVDGHIAFSRIAGAPDVMVAAQRSSARYLQRVDADHLSLDSAATALAGFSGRLQIAKRAGLHWRGQASYSTTSPGYETNDLGFQRDADRHRAGL
ncbi:MAG: hypothetical protein GWN73_39035, partial [Actinobacteria bacterium]|nr:hypothetical protein [Actinomycetota bacterium]NIS36534.1 hypothetical protein [Actinomycetota bacterium]NIU71045.1 hypothetical protein [Actinomycetota bacterium]NIV55713.1 hypothetical protein [Actinomycetota bacterium]NIV87107.1 hypothetical protein [Actinomycetota bacterium]